MKKGILFKRILQIFESSLRNDPFRGKKAVYKIFTIFFPKIQGA